MSKSSWRGGRFTIPLTAALLGLVLAVGVPVSALAAWATWVSAWKSSDVGYWSGHHWNKAATIEMGLDNWPLLKLVVSYPTYNIEAKAYSEVEYYLPSTSWTSIACGFTGSAASQYIDCNRLY